jgi:topoisomerase-4 subunit A
MEKDFSEIDIKGRSSRGNILTKNDIQKITCKHKGVSTLGGRKVWFDHDVLRLNYDGRGELLGEFNSDDEILVILNNGTWYTSNFDAGNHYPNNIFRIEKFDEGKVWTAALYDADQKNAYLKRFNFESSAKPLSFLGENPKSVLFLLTDTVYPYIEARLTGADADKEFPRIDAESFIGVKGYKAKGKRITTFKVGEVVELEPLRQPEEYVEEEIVEEEDPNALKTDEEGQISLF